MHKYRGKGLKHRRREKIQFSRHEQLHFSRLFANHAVSMERDYTVFSFLLNLSSIFQEAAQKEC